MHFVMNVKINTIYLLRAIKIHVKHVQNGVKLVQDVIQQMVVRNVESLIGISPVSALGVGGESLNIQIKIIDEINEGKYLSF